MKIQRIKAVTVLEIAIAMVISAIAISMAYSSFDFFNRLYKNFQRTNEKKGKLLLIDRLLRADLQNAIEVRKTPDGIDCAFPGKSVQYGFGASGIERVQAGQSEVFEFECSDLMVQFNGVEQYLSGFPVDYLQFSILADSAVLNVVYEKKYGADVYLNEGNGR